MTGTVTFLPPAVAVMVTGLPVSVAATPVTVTVAPDAVAVALDVSPLAAASFQPAALSGLTVTANVAVLPAATLRAAGLAATDSMLAASPALSAASRPYTWNM